MHILKKNFSLKENKVLEEKKFLNRRNILLGLAGLAVFPTMNASYAKKNDPNYAKIIKRKLTKFEVLSKYNNFFEFGTTKQIWKSAQNLNLENWNLSIEGGRFDKFNFNAYELIKKFDEQERIYKFRCVEAWSMVIPWNGFQLSELISYLEPESSTKFVAFQTFYEPSQASNQKQSWYPWPYTEIITLEEALNPLAFLATGVYGKELPKQNGAPIRLVLPWKYGFKSIKSITKIIFLKNKINSFWQTIEPKEYGFWANVNPRVAHRRWSQEFEKDIGTGNQYPTEIYNGYQEWVNYLYKDNQDKNLFF